MRKRKPVDGSPDANSWNHQESPGRPGALVVLAGLALFSGPLIGATTNAINGAVSPLYFINILGWHQVADVWRASIGQGILEGLIYGFVLALAFTVVVGIVGKGRCPFSFAGRYLLKIVGGINACWIVGGLIGMGLAALSPEFYRQTFSGVPEETGPMLRYAWVGGSIWGAMFGGLASVTLGCIFFALGWRRIHT